MSGVSNAASKVSLNRVVTVREFMLIYSLNSMSCRAAGVTVGISEACGLRDMNRGKLSLESTPAAFWAQGGAEQLG